MTYSLSDLMCGPVSHWEAESRCAAPSISLIHSLDVPEPRRLIIGFFLSIDWLEMCCWRLASYLTLVLSTKRSVLVYVPIGNLN